MKQFLLAISFLMVLLFGIRTFCHPMVGSHSCIPVHAQGVAGIDKYATEIKRIRDLLDKEISSLEAKSCDTEFCLKHILALLDFELEIIDNLVDGNVGLPIYQLQEGLNALIAQTVPSVMRIYDGIMNCATADASLLCKLRNIIREQERMCTFLFHNEKEHFLQHMTVMLESYYQLIRNKFV